MVSRQQSRGKLSRRQQRFAYVLVAPATITMAAILGLPLIQGIWLSFQRVKLNRPQLDDPFVGFENYAEMLTRSDFWAALTRSLIYTVGSVVGSFVIGYVVALVLNRDFRGRTVARTIMLLPWAIPLVAGTLVWGIMLDGNFGLINRGLKLLPFVDGNVEWLLDRSTALPAVIIVDVWHQFPIAMVFILAGLQSVPHTLYEAAAIDGASAWQQFRYVTWPSLATVNRITIVLLSIWAFRRFDVVFILTRGGPNKSTETLIMQTFDEAFRFFDFGYAATLGVASLLISIAFAVVYLRLAGGDVDQA